MTPRREDAHRSGVRHEGRAESRSATSSTKASTTTSAARSASEKFRADPAKYLAAEGSRRRRRRRPRPRRSYTCPMHPEVRQQGPGTCPKCGMALEPEMPTLDEGPNPEYVDFPPPLLVDAAAHRRGLRARDVRPPVPVRRRAGHANWIELVLATPVVLWAGWPFFVRCVDSIRTGNPNMWTLIGLGVAAAYVYSVVATVAPGIFPRGLRGARAHRRLLRGRRGDRLAHAHGPGARAARALADFRRHQGAAGPRAQDRASHARRRHRGGRAAHARARRRQAARAARREGAGGRRGARRALERGRVDDHRRADAGGEGAGRPGDRRHDQRQRQPRHPRRARRLADGARADRADGGAGAALARADAAHGRRRRALLRARRDRDRRGDVPRLGGLRARAALGVRACSTRWRCSSSRAPARWGWPRRCRSWSPRAAPPRAASCSTTPRRSRRCARSTRSSSTRPARSPLGKPAFHDVRRQRRLHGGRGAARRREPRPGQRASAGRRDRRGGATARARALEGRRSSNRAPASACAAGWMAKPSRSATRCSCGRWASIRRAARAAGRGAARRGRDRWCSSPSTGASRAWSRWPIRSRNRRRRRSACCASRAFASSWRPATGSPPRRRSAAKLGIDEVHGEVRPEDKLKLVERLQAEGRRRGDGGRRHQRRAGARARRRRHRDGHRHRRGDGARAR